MTRRRQRRLESRDGHLEVRFDEGEDHVHRGDAEYVHNERLIAFFDRFLR